MTEIILIVLILLMIIGALIAIETTSLLHSVISVGAVGFLLSIVFLFLSAPDLAITQIAVEVIALVLLLKTTKGSDTEPDTQRWLSFGRLSAIGIVIILALFSARMFDEFPEFGSPVMDRIADAPSNTYLNDGLEDTGAANIVTAVILDYRAYDTLGEATVLFCAVMGALTVLRRNAKKEPTAADEEDGIMSAPRESDGMSIVVKTVCGWVKGFILLYGIHLILYGHLTPGGGFAGGVIAAAAFMLIMLAEGQEAATDSFGRKAASTWDSVGVLLFWLMAMLGLVLAGTFFVNFWMTPESARLTLFSSGIIPPSNIGIGLKVCSSLFLVLLVLTSFNSHRQEEDAS